MEGYLYCQSCGMPLNPNDNLGTEKDHSRSTIYCSNCYQDGEFTHPEMTLDDMQTHIRREMRRRGFHETEIRDAVDKLRFLHRWLGIPAIHHTSVHH